MAEQSTLVRLSRNRHARASAALPLLIALWYLRKRIIVTTERARIERLPPMSRSELQLAQRDLFRKLPNGARELLVPNRGRVSKVIIHPTKPATFLRHRAQFLIAPPGAAPDSSDAAGETAARVGVNWEFFRQLRAIARIIIPRKRSKEAVLIVTHTAFLLLRTYLSLLVAKLDGKLVGDLVSANARGFINGLMLWFALAIPSVYTNAMIRFLQQKLSISFRTRLTRYIHDLYLSPKATYYRIPNLDSRIEGADQYIATDVARFCDSLSNLYSNLGKPAVDLVLFNIQLGRSIGRWGSLGLAVSYVCTAFILRRLTPAFGKLAAIEAKLEGDFRNAHARLQINAEEVAFYQGQAMELTILNRAYQNLIRHVNSIFRLRIAYSMLEDMVIKYAWSACGYLLISIPVFFPRGGRKASGGVKGPEERSAVHSASIASRTENYISNRRLLLSLADAGGRMMYAYKDLAELAGFTSRVFALLSTLHSLDSGLVPSLPRPEGLNPDWPFYDIGDLHGKFIKSGEAVVKLEGVPIVAPAPGVESGGDQLVAEMDLEIKQGEHLLITGPNGCGKTSVARVFAGIWPVFEGVVTVPKDSEIYFLPQRPYFSAGSLRDQIIYPQAYPDYAASGKTEQDLMEILKNVFLDYIPAREGGMDTVKEWKDVLSGGEKQRMGFARLLYHMPKFGVLDEATSAVSSDVEGKMYNHAKEVGITLITISHRPSLFKYHDHLLRITGEEGEYELTRIGTEQEHLSFRKELEAVEKALEDVDELQKELDTVNEELARNSSHA